MSDSRLLRLKARAYDLIALIESAQAELREVNRQIAQEAGRAARPETVEQSGEGLPSPGGALPVEN